MAQMFHVSFKTIDRDLKAAESEVHRIFDEYIEVMTQTLYMGWQTQ